MALVVVTNRKDVVRVFVDSFEEVEAVSRMAISSPNCMGMVYRDACITYKVLLSRRVGGSAAGMKTVTLDRHIVREIDMEATIISQVGTDYVAGHR